MRSLPLLRHARLRLLALALACTLAILATLVGAVPVSSAASLQPGPAADAFQQSTVESERTQPSPLDDPSLAPPAARTSAQRAAVNPDLPTLPPSCRPPYGYMPLEPCRLVPRKPGAPLIVLWGDSHAWMMTPAIRQAVAHEDVNVVALMQGSCPPMDANYDNPKKYAARNTCDDFGHLALDFIKRASKQKRPLRVIVAMSWELYHNVTDPPNVADKLYPGFVNEYLSVNARKSIWGTPRAFKALSRMHVKTDVVAPMPMVYQSAPECPNGGFQCRDLPRAGVLKDAKENNARVWAMRKLLSNKGIVIRPAKSLCNNLVCRGKIGDVPTYWDRLHVGQRASYLLAPHFAATVRGVVQAAARQRANAR